MSNFITPQTVTYKKIGRLEISIDVYLPLKSKSVPILLWFHGGGLLQGHRNAVPPHLIRSIEKYGHALISADYRLAPQATISEILDDVKDCVSFIRDDNGLKKTVGSDKINTTKLAVAGSSAGGYLALLAGLYCEPKPNVILAIYPITDPLGTFFTNSQPYPLFKPPGAVDRGRRVTEEDIAAYRDPKASQVANCERSSKRSNFYAYMMAEANLAKLLGFHGGEEAMSDSRNDRFRIAKTLADKGLPPTYIVHGDIDRAVGVEQADEVFEVLTSHGMNVHYERLKGKDHLFDVDSSVDLPQLYDFMQQHFHESRL